MPSKLAGEPGFGYPVSAEGAGTIVDAPSFVVERGSRACRTPTIFPDRGLSDAVGSRLFLTDYSAAAGCGRVSSRPRCATAAVEGSPSPATCTVGNANLMPFSSKAFLIIA